ncbi:hypothetical protein ACFVS2_21090 [Brevibacillus sp. NPDC058079]|uniref:hypothetical protein n=1 Tax=Brevibacillus sp. NPDC058079 TaxID=3346330 RepID=UPI0036E088E0
MSTQLFGYEITESDLKHQNVDKLIGIIDRLKDDGPRFRNSLKIICQVYIDSPDELHTIPKYRRFIRKVATLRPYFLYYMNLDLEFLHILGCLGDVETLSFDKQMSTTEVEQTYGSPLFTPLMQVKISLDQDVYTKMEESIKSLCVEIDDPVGQEELITFLESFKPNE